MACGPDGVKFATPAALKSVATEKSGQGGGKSQSHLDHAVAALAEQQHGVVAVWQLVAIGLGRDAIRYREKVGRLHRIHHGVYAVGYRKLTPQGHRMAAVLASGPDAVLSHWSAAAQWGFGQSRWKTDVTTPSSRRSRKTIRAHTATLHPEERTVHDGIPITSVERTILDLAAHLSKDQLAHLIEEADRKQRFDLRKLDRAIARRPHVKGVARLKTVLAAYRGTADTRSHLERKFRKLIATANLPEPQFNVLVAGLTVDVYWPQWKLVVELDGEPYHDNPVAFETDRIRDATLQKHDIRILRVTGDRLDNAPDAVLADVLALRRL